MSAHLLSVFLLISLSVNLFACLNMSICVCLVCCLSNVYLHLCPLSVRQFTCQSECVCLSVYIDKQTWVFPPIGVTIHLPEYVNVCPHVFCIQLHICVGVFPIFVCMSICMCACLCVCLPMSSIRWYVFDKQTDRHIFTERQM